MTEPTDQDATARCDVCHARFEPAEPGQHRCSDACREFAREHRYERTKVLHRLWLDERARQEPCPGGKVRHQNRAEAEKAARKAVRARYAGWPDWLRVYQCDLCRNGWHLTSKPARAKDIAAGIGGER